MGSLKSRLVTGVSFIILMALLTTLFGPSTYAQADPRIESNDSQVQVAGKWVSQNATAASGGNYLYSSGAEADVLTFEFSGSSIEVIYVAGPSLGTLAIDIDGTVLRTVITTAEQTAYQQSSRIDYLTDETHTVQIYAQEGGVVGVDAFIVHTTPTPDTTLASNEGDGGMQATHCSPVSIIHRVSVTATGGNGAGSSTTASISADGRYVAFESTAPLVATDGNGTFDIYVYDRQTCTIELISVGASGGENLASSFDPAISGNGRYVTFESPSNVLVANDTNNLVDIFVRDRQTGTTTRVSIDSSGAQTTGGFSANPAISGNGRYIAFQSDATNLVAGDTNGVGDVFVRDIQTNTTTRVSISDNELQSSGGASDRPSFSEDGRYVVFQSLATNLVTGDTNSQGDIFVRDTVANTTTRASLADDESQSTGGISDNPVISNSGRFVAFESQATNLVLSDTNGFSDIFVRDTVANTTTRQSVSSNGTQSNQNSFNVSMSADGRYLTFWSSASNLVANDTNNNTDCFLRDTQTNTTIRVSLTFLGGQATGNVSVLPVISADGRYIAFQSRVTNIVPNDTNAESDIFVTRGIQPTPHSLALFNANFNHVDLLSTLADNPPYTAFTAFSAYAPISGGTWVMGDWNGDGQDTPGVYANGPFFFTNKSGESQPSDWGGFWIGINGPPVAGRFSPASANDCVGAVDSVPVGSLTIFALYFTCDLTGTNPTPPLTFQWLSSPLPNPIFTGTHQFMAGDFNGDGLDSIAIRRNEFIAYGNVYPAAGPAVLDLAQYIGVPGTGDNGTFVVGDWDSDGVDSFGLFYQNGELFYRNDLDFNSGVHFNQTVGTPFAGTVQVATWR